MAGKLKDIQDAALPVSPAALQLKIALLAAAFFLFIAVAVAGYFIWQNMSLQGQLKDLSIRQSDTEMKLQQLTGQHNQLSGDYTRLSQQLEGEKQNVSAS